MEIQSIHPAEEALAQTGILGSAFSEQESDSIPLSPASLMSAEGCSDAFARLSYALHRFCMYLTLCIL